MKSKYNSVILLLIAIILLNTIIFQSCKNESVVQPHSQNNQNPTAPLLLSPNNESTSRILSTTLVWQSFPSAVSYEVQISLDANISGTMILDTSVITGTQVRVPFGKLITNIYYYWRVKAVISENNASQWSSIWRFNIILNAPLPPNLISPPNGAVDQSFTPSLQWGFVDSAQFYRVQLSSSSNFSHIIFDSSHILVNQVQVPIFNLNTGTQYFWRGNASNSNGVSTSQWSSVFNFTTINGPHPNSISGSIVFVDTNFVMPLSLYKVAAYSSWSPRIVAGSSDTFNIRRIGNVYQADYIITHLYNGNYILAATYALGLAGSSYVMGIYGCDTVHIKFSTCPNNPTTVPITNNFGIVNINFLSWADTTKKIF